MEGVNCQYQGTTAYISFIKLLTRTSVVASHGGSELQMKVDGNDPASACDYVALYASTDR